MKEDWIRKLFEHRDLGKKDDHRSKVRNTAQGDRQFYERIEGFWSDIVAELESAIRSFNELSPPDGRVTFKRALFDFTAKKEKARSPHNILCVRLDLETRQILSFQRLNSFYEVKLADDELQMIRPDGSRVDKVDLAEELLSELFLTP